MLMVLRNIGIRSDMVRVADQAEEVEAPQLEVRQTEEQAEQMEEMATSIQPEHIMEVMVRVPILVLSALLPERFMLGAGEAEEPVTEVRKNPNKAERVALAEAVVEETLVYLPRPELMEPQILEVVVEGLEGIKIQRENETEEMVVRVLY